MDTKEFLLEVYLGTDDKTNKIFNYALSQVFAPSYVSKINNIMGKEITIKEVSSDKNFVSYQEGNSIVVNKPVFYSKSKEDQMRNLLHEFIHILQTSKSMLIFSKFKEINVLSKELYDIVKSNLVKPLSVFLTSKNIKLLSDSKEEILGYMMSGNVDWSAVKPQAKREFIGKLSSSGIFNLNTSFWKKRLA